MNAGRTFSIASFPAESRNPYLTLFYRAMERHGFCFLGGFSPVAEWLRGEGRDVDACHFHWPESIWRTQFQGRLAKLQRILELRAFARLARQSGKAVVWTVHNVLPHEDAHWIDWMGGLALAHSSDLLIVHSATALRSSRRRFLVGRRPLCVVEHGTYDTWYPQARDPQVVLQEVGLDPAQPVVAMIGQIRPYKGVDLAAEAMMQVADAQLLIAGSSAIDPSQLSRIEERLGKRVAIVPRFLSDQEVADYTNAAQLCLFPYSRITGSGALLLSITFGKPFVASNLPFFREFHASSPDTGEVFTAGDPQACAQAISRVLSDPRYGERQQACLDLRARLNWDDAVAPFAQRLHSLLARRSP